MSCLKLATALKVQMQIRFPATSAIQARKKKILVADVTCSKTGNRYFHRVLHLQQSLVFITFTGLFSQVFLWSRRYLRKVTSSSTSTSNWWIYRLIDRSAICWRCRMEKLGHQDRNGGSGTNLLKRKRCVISRSGSPNQSNELELNVTISCLNVHLENSDEALLRYLGTRTDRTFRWVVS